MRFQQVADGPLAKQCLKHKLVTGSDDRGRADHGVLQGVPPISSILLQTVSVDTLGVSRGSYAIGEKELMLRSLKRVGVNGYFVAIYRTFTPLDIANVHINCAGSQSLGGRGGCF